MGKITERYEVEEPVTKEVSVRVCDQCNAQVDKEELVDIIIDPHYTDAGRWQTSEVQKVITDYLGKEVDWHANRMSCSNGEDIFIDDSNIEETLATRLKNIVNIDISIAATYEICTSCAEIYYDATLLESDIEEEKMYAERNTTVNPQTVIPPVIWVIFGIVLAIALFLAAQFPTLGLGLAILIVSGIVVNTLITTNE